MMLQQFVNRERFESQHRENQARHAFSWGQFDSTGWGELFYPDVLDFGLVFLTEPIVTYGFSVEDSDGLDRLPTCSGGVFKWRRDGRGYYTGAHVYVVVNPFVVVDVEPVEPADYDKNPTIVHSYMFAGTAIKDIGPDEFRDD